MKNAAVTALTPDLRMEYETLDHFGSRDTPKRIFLLSPANISGVRGQLILREEAGFELAARLRDGGASLGEIFSFVSGLYFRGKLAYARMFAEPPAGAPGIMIITASRGLLAPEALLSSRELREMSQVPIDARDLRYRSPLERDAMELHERIGKNCEVVLLGSIATPKYVEPLSDIFRSRLFFPADFIGRGDMSRGALMLRSARDRVQLSYVAAAQSLPPAPKPAQLVKSRR